MIEYSEILVYTLYTISFKIGSTIFIPCTDFLFPKKTLLRPRNYYMIPMLSKHIPGAANSKSAPHFINKSQTNN